MSTVEHVMRRICCSTAVLSLLVSGASSYTFALIPKQTNNSFFDVVNDGCQGRAAQLDNVTCRYVGPPYGSSSSRDDALLQAKIIDDIIAEGVVDGISLSVIDLDIATEAISRAMAAGIPVITFDSDAAGSERMAFIGTDNFKFGVELGKVLDQLAPTGGGYGMISARAPNVMEVVDGVRSRLEGTKWYEVQGSPTDCQDSTELALQQMWEFAENPEVDAIVATGAWAMLDSNTSRWKAFVDANRHITLVGNELLPTNIDLMNQGYVNGLVGQLPYQMGEMSMDTLLDIKKGNEIEQTIFGTALLEVLRFPLILPQYTKEMYYIGNLAILGCVVFAIIAASSIGFSMWTFYFRGNYVVRASQPLFLVMICAGTLIMGSSIIPLSIDDGTHSQRGTDIACMCTPWLLSIGFITCFSALFSKTWRVNKIVNNPNRFKRVKVDARDVIAPYVALMAVNIVALSCWTAIAPLRFVRFDNAGTDDWNRVLSSYGRCVSTNDARGGSIPYVVIIAVVNAGVLILANLQAYQSRKVGTEFSESRYIAIIMASMLQACAIGIPIVFLVWDLPQVYYIVLLSLIFVICMVVLLVMFLPKIMFMRKWQEEQEKRRRERALRLSTCSRHQSSIVGLKISLWTNQELDERNNGVNDRESDPKSSDVPKNISVQTGRGDDDGESSRKISGVGLSTVTDFSMAYDKVKDEESGSTVGTSKTTQEKSGDSEDDNQAAFELEQFKQQVQELERLLEEQGIESKPLFDAAGLPSSTKLDDS